MAPESALALTLAIALGGFCAILTLLHLASVAIAAWRCRRRPTAVLAPANAVPVTLLRPVCGIDPFARETLDSGFRLDYPEYEVVFCVAREDDKAVPLLRELMAAHPHIPSRLLFGDARISGNPKLNNVVKGWDAARHDWIVMADSNVLMPADYIQRLQSRWQADSGLVCAPPRGALPGNGWAILECAFLNSFQARYQYVGEALGMGFAQGKTMYFRRDVVEGQGGIRALGAELAEDAATTKLVHAAGLRVHLSNVAFAQPLGQRRLQEVWGRQLRWARLRRSSFPLFFAPEILVGAVFPLIAGMAAWLLAGGGVPGAAALALALAAIWYAAEVGLCAAAGWHLSWRTPFMCLLRDLMLPPLWVTAWSGSGFTWRGTGMDIRAVAEQDATNAA